MAIISRRTFIWGAFVAYVAYMVYEIPIPPGVDEPNKLRLSLAINKFYHRSANFLDFVGVVSDYVAIRWLRRKNISPIEGVQSVDTVFDGVPVRVYTPDGMEEASKAMVYYHGGGWVLGNVNTHHAVTWYFAKEANLVVVSVDYRLVPEHSKRDGLEDCVKATKYLLRNADMYGVDGNRVVVAGDSAGGNFAAAVALHLRDDVFTPMPKLQLLIYPAVQGIDMELPSMQQNPQGPILSMSLINWFMSYISGRNKRFMSYFRSQTHVPAAIRASMAKQVLNHDLLPDVYKYPPYQKPNYERGGSEIWHKIQEDFMDGYFFPLMAKDHSDLPEAYIFTAQYDPLRDEGYLYGHKLKASGVQVTIYNYNKGWHGMVNAVLLLNESTIVMDKMVEFLNDRL